MAETDDGKHFFSSSELLITAVESKRMNVVGKLYESLDGN
jgi:hypothetical protein